jgi:hypothetical protein
MTLTWAHDQFQYVTTMALGLLEQARGKDKETCWKKLKTWWDETLTQMIMWMFGNQNEEFLKLPSCIPPLATAITMQSQIKLGQSLVRPIVLKLNTFFN